MLTLFFRNIVPLILRLFLIDLDFAPIFIRNVAEFSILNINFGMLFLGFALLSFGLVFLIGAFKFANESIIKNLDCIIPYIICYPYLLAKIWILVFLELAIGKRQKW
jgi:hypothetical protein